MRSLLIALLLVPSLCAAERLRVLVETDAGGDPDDEQSMVRFLLYVNEWDVEGIIANRPTARDGENRNNERTGLGIVQQLIKAYGQCWPNLVQHDDRYPKPNTLLARTVAGYNDTDAGVNLILRAVDSPDARPLWYMDWGTDHGAATNNMLRALDRVLRERGADGYAAFKNRIRLICAENLLPQHVAREPAFPIWINTWQPPGADKLRWYHRFSAITANAGGFDIVKHVLTNHGPLGALYPTNTTHWLKEGDSMSFLYLVPTGMNDPTQPSWGSWAGRYGLRDNYPGKQYFWANQTDSWSGTTNRDNTLRRWAAHLQNDFRARLDWCVKPFGAANHPPKLKLNGKDDGIVMIDCEPGERVRLDASGSADPDENAIDYDWFVYPEPGSYRGYVNFDAPNAPRARVQVPEDAGGKTIHLILSATDSGEPPLTRYRRAVLNVKKK